MRLQRVAAAAVAGVVTVAVMVATLTAVPATSFAGGNDDGWGRDRDRHRSDVRVGAASRSVLPLVGGRLSYLRAGLPSRRDAFDPGIPVPAWDDGRIAVGNGASESHWVHDDLRVTAMAVEDSRSPDLLVLVSTDVYMIFRQDADLIRAKALAQLPRSLAGRTRILVTSTHNHHGPDTAFDVNHPWYEHMADQAAAAVVDAVRNRRRAVLRTAAGEHWFGARDGTDPQILDPRLNVLQAVGSNGRVIATAVQWNDHPETTLGWEPPAEAIAADCPTLGLTGDNCKAEGRYLTSDFPGVLRQDLQARMGGEVLYFNGALGLIVGPGGADVWEVDRAHPLGNGLKAPSGAVAPGGGTDYTQENFRRAVLIGDQLAGAVLRLLWRSEKLRDTRLTYAVQPFVARLTNIGFRALLVVDPTTGRTQLGHEVGKLLTCPATGPKDETTCTSDELVSEPDELIELPVRKGDHFASAVEYVRIGPIGMMFLPGETAGELVAGLPADFRTDPQRWYEEEPGRHAFGADFVTGGYITRRMHDRYEWPIGLGSDELGYIIPISNFRVRCVADEVAGPGTCEALHGLGVIEYPDSIAGTTCKRITDDPSQLTLPEPLATAVSASCRYGQALGEAEGHYEETNSASWDTAQAVLDAVAVLTGDNDPTEVNPDFPGWWQGNLPG